MLKSIITFSLLLVLSSSIYADVCPSPDEIRDAAKNGYLKCTSDYNGDNPDWCGDYLNGFYVQGNLYNILGGNLDFQKVVLNDGDSAVACYYDNAEATINQGVGVPLYSHWVTDQHEENSCGPNNGSSIDECSFDVKQGNQNPPTENP